MFVICRRGEWLRRTAKHSFQTDSHQTYRHKFAGNQIESKLCDEIRSRWFTLFIFKEFRRDNERDLLQHCNLKLLSKYISWEMLTNVVHCTKSICIWSFSAYISVFSPNAGIYGPENCEYGHFPCSDLAKYFFENYWFVRCTWFCT